MSVLCITPCGNRKIWGKNPNAGPTKAKDVYVGPFTKKCGEYAAHFYPDSWYILSAKYGFLLPDDVIPESYDVTFNDKSTNPISIRTLKKQVRDKGLYHYDRIVIVAGNDYAKIAKEIFEDKVIHVPLESYDDPEIMLQILLDAIKNNREV